MSTFSHLIKLDNGVFVSANPQLQNLNPMLKNYLDNVPKYWLPGGVIEFMVIYHGAHDYYDMGDWFGGQDELEYKKGRKIYPIVHLTIYNIFKHEIAGLTQAPKRYNKIIDSSIWNYYIPLDITIKDADGNELRDIDGNNQWEYSNNYKLFADALNDIARNKKEGLYDLSVAHEFADLNARLVKQSHLNGDGHKGISPFLFHSENEMRERIDEYNEKANKYTITLDKIKKYRWRFLLLDDKSIKSMSSVNDCNGTSIKDINKLQIIAHNLHRILGFDEERIWFRTFMFGFDNTNNKIVKEPSCFGRVKNGAFKPVKELPAKKEDIQIVIDCVEGVSEAEACLRQYRYEIVLLDYLLNNEYGYQLLTHLQKWHEAKEKRKKDGVGNDRDDFYKPGPNKRFYFMFISAFHTAVQERMLEQGFGRTERSLWYIGDGACPTNTPYLFSYQLLLLMRHRITDLRKENEGGCLTLVELLKEIYVNRDKAGLVDVRERANKHFNHVLYMRSKYHHLEQDFYKEDERKDLKGDDIMNMRSSLLIQSVFGYVHHFSGAMFEHLQHLVYLTAFGTIRQWTELWEEYVFIHKILTQYDALTGKSDGKVINRAIRNYIIKLKENSN